MAGWGSPICGVEIAAYGGYWCADSKKCLLEQIHDGKGCLLFPAYKITSGHYRRAPRGEAEKLFPWGEDMGFLRFAEAALGLCSQSSSRRGSVGAPPLGKQCSILPCSCPFASVHLSCSCSLGLAGRLQNNFIQLQTCSEIRGTSWEQSSLSQSIDH